MAWIERNRYTGSFRLCFRHGGKKLNRALKTADRKDAEALLHRLEANLRLLARGRLVLPEGADLPTFLLSDGQLTGKPRAGVAGCPSRGPLHFL
jgi:hypothetical protein